MMTALPRFVQIEPVGECNLRCRMCPIQFRQDGRPHGPPAFLDFDLFERLLDQFGEIDELHLQGLGEPLMHPRFFDMVSAAKARGIQVSTNTNLTLLTPARAERCVTSGLDTIHVSLDGASATVYETIRVRAKFDKVLRNPHRLRAIKIQRESASPAIRIVLVAMRQNLHEIPDVVELAAEFGVNTVFVQHLCHDFSEPGLPERYRPMRDFIDEQSLLGESDTVVASCFSKAKEMAERLHVDLRLPDITPTVHPIGTPGRERCHWPWHGAYLSYRGEAMPCCMVATPDRIHFGNMAQQGVEPIWNSDAYNAFRDQLASNTPPDVCQSCAVYHRTF